MANIRGARRSGRVFRGGRNVRESLWIGITPTNTNLPSANSVGLFTGLNATALQLRPFTVVRTRITWHVQSDQRTATELYQVALGISIVSEQALAIGATAVPTPFADIASDLWFVYDTIVGQISVTTDVGVLEAGQMKDIDSRAMRKVEDGQDLAIVVENSSVALGTDVRKSGRMLVKLH